MQYTTKSSKAIIAKIYRDFKPSNSAWVGDAYEWIGEAIELIGCFTGYELLHKDFEVIDYRVKLPCDIEQLMGIEYNGMRLQRSGGINAGDNCSCVDNLTCHPEENYSLNPNYIQTTFQTGCIKIHYKAIPTDCDGFPMVVDRVKVTQAIEWYVMRGMLLRGFKHQTVAFADADKMWEKYYPQAQNDLVFSTIDDWELFKKSWLGLVKSTNMTNEMFNTVVSDNNSNQANAPGSLITNDLTVVRT